MIANQIVFEDQHLLVLNKAAGIPVQPDQTGDESLLDQATQHCKTELFLVHRIDRPVSGLVLLAKTKAAAAALQEQFQKGRVEKRYLAGVAQLPPEKEGTLQHFLVKDSLHKKARLHDHPVAGGEKAVLHYRVLGSGTRYHLLEIRLETGRFHQIRAQLAAIGCCIKGDVKYGARRNNPDRSIHLHAWRLTVAHPASAEIRHFTAALPGEDPVWAAFSTMIDQAGV